MTPERIAEVLAGPHQGVLSVARIDKGPLAVPMSYHYAGGRFWMVSDPDSLHGRLMRRRGRATLTVQYELVDGLAVHQWYVIAEGPVAFTDDDPLPHVRAMLAKDRGPEHVDAWMAGATGDPGTTAVLDPERLGGHEWRYRA